jgi:hypothetical protein
LEAAVWASGVFRVLAGPPATGKGSAVESYDARCSLPDRDGPRESCSVPSKRSRSWSRVSANPVGIWSLQDCRFPPALLPRFHRRMDRWRARNDGRPVVRPLIPCGRGTEGPPDGNTGDQEELVLGLIGERRFLRKGHDAGIRRRGSDTERPFGLDTPNPFPLVRSSPPRRLCRRRTGADRGEGSDPCGFLPCDPLSHPAHRPADSRNAYSQALLE